jgi:hypothetical protein
MNDEQGQELIDILREIKNALQEKEAFKINEALKNIVPDEWKTKTEGNKTLSVNIGAIKRRKILNIIKEV